MRRFATILTLSSVAFLATAGPALPNPQQLKKDYLKNNGNKYMDKSNANLNNLKKREIYGKGSLFAFLDLETLLEEAELARNGTILNITESIEEDLRYLFDEEILVALVSENGGKKDIPPGQAKKLSNTYWVRPTVTENFTAPVVAEETTPATDAPQDAPAETTTTEETAPEAAPAEEPAPEAAPVALNSYMALANIDQLIAKAKNATNKEKLNKLKEKALKEATKEAKKFADSEAGQELQATVMEAATEEVTKEMNKQIKQQIKATLEGAAALATEVEEVSVEPVFVTKVDEEEIELLTAEEIIAILEEGEDELDEVDHDVDTEVVEEDEEDEEEAESDDEEEDEEESDDDEEESDDDEEESDDEEEAEHEDDDEDEDEKEEKSHKHDHDEDEEDEDHKHHDDKDEKDEDKKEKKEKKDHDDEDEDEEESVPTQQVSADPVAEEGVEEEDVSADAVPSIDAQTLVNADIIEAKNVSSTPFIFTFAAISLAVLVMAGLVLRQKRRTLIENNIQERLIDNFVRV